MTTNPTVDLAMFTNLANFNASWLFPHFFPGFYPRFHGTTVYTLVSSLVAPSR